MTTVTRRPARGMVYALAAAALFGVNGSMSKVVMQAGITAPQLTWMRTTTTWIIAGAVLVIVSRSSFRVTWRQLGAYALIGIAGLAMVQFLYAVAIRELPVGIALLFEYLAVILVALTARFVFKERVHPRVWWAILLVVAGLAVVAQVWNSHLSALGVLAGFASAFAFAWYFVGGERVVAAHHPMAVSFWAGLFASAFWSLFSGWWHLDPGQIASSISLSGALSSLHWPMWVLLAWIASLGGFAPFMLIFAAMRHVSATTAGLIATSEVLFAFLVAWAWLGETLALVQIAGAAMVFAGIIAGQTARVDADDAIAGPGDTPSVPVAPDHE